MTTYSVTFNGVLEASLGTILPGVCVCRDSSGKFYVPSTPANRGTQRTRGMITFTAVGGKACQIQYAGEASAETTQIPPLAVVSGGRSWIRVNAGAYLERANPILPGDEIVGWCDEFGNALLGFGTIDSSVLATLSGDVTGPAANNTVEKIRGILLSALAPSAGQVLTATGPTDAAWATPSITLGGDATGPSGANTVAAIQHVSVSASAPTVGQVLTATSGSAAQWSTPSTTVTLGGDVTGSSSSNVAEKIHGATVPIAGALTTGNVLQVSGSSALSYGPVNLAGGSNYVTGTLPATNLPNAAGDVTGAITSNVVEKVHGATVPIAGALTTGNTLQVAGASALSYGPLNLAGGSNYVTGTLPVGNLPSLAGDVSGTLSTTSVDKVHGATIPAAGALVTGNAPYVSGPSALTYSALNLAGGSGWVSGVLPAGNMAAPAGDVTGATIAANRVTTISGSTSGNTVTMTSGVNFVYTTGTQDVSGSYYRWTGNGILVLPSANAQSLLAGISATTAGLWFSTNVATPTSSNATVFYNATTDVASLQSATNAGKSQLVVNGTVVGVEAASLTGRLITSINRKTTVTSTQVPNALIDGVSYVSDAVTIPTLPQDPTNYPVGGCIVYSTSGALYHYGSDGDITCLAPS